MTKSARDLLRLDRRELMATLGVALFAGPGCGRQPETPLPRLKGRAWVQGVYELHAQRYLDVQMGAETSSHGAYRVLAQKGVTALDGLQSREVPFHMRVDAASSRVQIERTVPERLTFTADMSVADRERATEAYHAARQHLHTDYYEIHRLDWAMSTLLGQLLAIHSAMEQAEIEQFKIVRDLAGLRGGGATPYQLPERVTRDDYVEVLVLLLARLEQDRARLASIEASIATVGLTARSTDAGSGSLTKNLHKVMLSVIHDAEATTPTPARFPASTKQTRVAAGRELASQIEASTAYQEWKRAEDARALESAGMLFEAIDAVTHLPTSALFRTVIGIWRGEGDYLTYLQVLARIVPGGGRLAGVVRTGIDTSKRARDVIARAQGARERLKRGDWDQALESELAGRANAVLNTRTAFARKRIERQVTFFSEEKELGEVASAVAASPLMTRSMPPVPPPPAPPR